MLRFTVEELVLIAKDFITVKDNETGELKETCGDHFYSADGKTVVIETHPVIKMPATEDEEDGEETPPAE